ncbi:sensor histidine kinase [Nonomuraea soli]|uniref:histidine kinase n=1 Tax=Nonomuraea soli TaxID=1032476 RepID=A0A7W0CG85_9ACTN|nr:HAMP domain-containing sensor histidine kinase [Nonomuraea soli]MBA2890599.1 signal transduction histidine kinase [Nonomuraea soli]
MARIWARTLRGRVTLIAAAVAAFVLLPVGIGGVVAARGFVETLTWTETRNTAAQITAQHREGRVSFPTDAYFAQIVTASGDVVAASPAALGLPRLSTAWPTADNRILNTTSCLATGCLHVTAIRESTRPESAVVYAAQRSPVILSTWMLEAIITAQMLLLVALISWITWLMAGRALRPVARIRAQLDEVNATDLSRRVTEPMTQDEVAQLARSINGTLGRLERSAEQQRQFAHDASHELRTPIAGLRAQLESAQLYPDDTDVGELVEGALRDTDRIEAIITDLLLLARIGSRVDVTKEPVDLGILVRKALSDRSGGVPITAELGDGIVVNGVRLQLDRLLANLLDNAERHALSRIDITLSASDAEAVLTVENDGPPIPEADRERIFERFTRLDSARSRDEGGTGLGLAIAREVALAHRGALTVDRDARFTLRLPLAEPE